MHQHLCGDIRIKIAKKKAHVQTRDLNMDALTDFLLFGT